MALRLMEPYFWSSWMRNSPWLKVNKIKSATYCQKGTQLQIAKYLICLEKNVYEEIWEFCEWWILQRCELKFDSALATCGLPLVQHSQHTFDASQKISFLLRPGS